LKSRIYCRVSPRIEGQDTKDRLRDELDFDVNATSEIQGRARRLNLLDDKIDDVGNLLRGRSLS